MKTSPGILIIALCATLTAFGATPAAPADKPAKPMVLRSVMQQLGRDTQSVTAAISRADWTRVVELASRIAHHSEPPLSEKMRILAWLGTDAGKFRGFDEGTHEAAQAMGQAAERGDGKAVIQSFARMQESCLACHQAFRKPFVERFYGQR